MAVSDDAYTERTKLEMAAGAHLVEMARRRKTLVTYQAEKKMTAKIEKNDPQRMTRIWVGGVLVAVVSDKDWFMPPDALMAKLALAIQATAGHDAFENMGTYRGH